MKLLSHTPRPVIVLAAALVGFTALADQAPAKKLSRLQGSAYIDRNRMCQEQYLQTLLMNLEYNIGSE